MMEAFCKEGTVHREVPHDVMVVPGSGKFIATL